MSRVLSLGHFQTETWSDDPDDAFRFKELLEEMIAD